MTKGEASFTVKFPAAGCYRLSATGPGGGEGWVTGDVG
jgi:hypothetical protein